MARTGLRAVDRAFPRSPIGRSDRHDALADAVHHRDEPERYPGGDPQRVSPLRRDRTARRLRERGDDRLCRSRISSVRHRRARARHAGRRVRAAARAGAGVLRVAPLPHRHRLGAPRSAPAAAGARSDRDRVGCRSGRAVLRSLLRVGLKRRVDRRDELRGQARRLSAASVRGRDRDRHLSAVRRPVREQESHRRCAAASRPA